MHANGSNSQRCSLLSYPFVSSFQSYINCCAEATELFERGDAFCCEFCDPPFSSQELSTEDFAALCSGAEAQELLSQTHYASGFKTGGQREALHDAIKASIRDFRTYEWIKMTSVSSLSCLFVMLFLI